MSTETSDKTLSGIFYLLTVMCLLYGMTDIGESVFKNSIASQEWLSSILNNYYDLIIVFYVFICLQISGYVELKYGKDYLTVSILSILLTPFSLFFVGYDKKNES